jgi:hypothetical protein
MCACEREEDEWEEDVEDVDAWDGGFGVLGLLRELGPGEGDLSRVSLSRA